MTGVMTAVFVLTFTCYGEFCGPMDRVEQRAELPSQQTCVFLRDAVMQRSSAMAMIAADCRGEAREVRPAGPLVGSYPR